MNIVVTGLQSWDSDIGSNCIDISRELAKNHNVLYVNYPLDRMTVYRNSRHPKIKQRMAVLKSKAPDLVKVEENLWVFTPPILLESISRIAIPFLFDFINTHNNVKYANAIKTAIDKLNFNDFILLNDNDIYRTLHFKKLLNPRLYIYYLRDYMIETAYYKYHGQRIEHILIKNADAIFTNSLFLEKYAQTINNVCFFTGQGCDTHLYDPESITSVPEDIIQIPYPIIGYTGALRTLRLDIPLLETIASKRPNWSFVFIGTEDESFSKSALHFMPNVHFLGSRDAHLLPTYVSSFDVAINPQIVNKTTLGNYPRKIDEYLSMGKPVVATRTEAMEMFSDYVFLADNCETFIQGIDYALQHNTPAQIQARKEYAQTHTWEKVVKTMIQIIQNNFKIY